MDIGIISAKQTEELVSCFDKLSMNGYSLVVSEPVPFALSLSKGERSVF
jgi:hypothetical protein